VPLQANNNYTNLQQPRKASVFALQNAPTVQAQLEDARENTTANVVPQQAQAPGTLDKVVQSLNSPVMNELIIQPSEGPQTNFFCINEQGGKIGRHSSS
jgi:hypothetical protein